MSQAGDALPELRALIDGLADPDPARQEAALRELRDRANQKSLSATDGAYLLRAAGKQYPPIKDNPTTCVAAELIRAVASMPDRSHVAIVREIFDSLQLPPRPWGLGDPRTAALDLLARMDDEVAAQALLELLEHSVAAGSPLLLPVGSLRWKPRLAQVYFPRMLASAVGDASRDVFQLCFEYARKGLLPPEQLAPHARVLVDAYARMRPGTDADTAGLLLDLMGYFQSPDVEPVLAAATELDDLTLAGYAACALLRLGRHVDARLLERLAATPEKRAWLFEELARSGRRELFPAAWATQAALAEGVMVRWLVHSNELGRPPDEIELVTMVEDGPPGAVLQWYLFRFRTEPPHWASENGWMTGLAGPFEREPGPTTADHGRTWSSFTRWDSMTSQQHVEHVRQSIRRFRQSRSS